MKKLPEGEAGKYFKYAVGEIFLVVIGILIVLQLNNLNEKKKVISEKKAMIRAKFIRLPQTII